MPAREPRQNQKEVGFLFELVIPDMLQDAGEFRVGLRDVGKLIDDQHEALIGCYALDFIKGSFPRCIATGVMNGGSGVLKLQQSLRKAA